MRSLSLKSGLITALLFTALTSAAQVQKQHVISLDTPSELHQFFQYQPASLPIISGHRGGLVSGFPENSLEAMEHTLKHTTAFFELDPRLTKDSVIVLMHDATLDRTTNGKGKLSEYTWEEVKKLRLKDHEGKLTDFRIPTLQEAIVWAKGKTILNLDHKDVPYQLIADLIKQHQAHAFVMLTVHSPEHAQFYLDRDKEATFSAHIKTPEAFQSYKNAGIPWSQLIAYIGSVNTPKNNTMIDLLHGVGVKVMISTGPTDDKLPTKQDRAKAYRDFMSQGPDIIESDLPLEVNEALRNSSN